MKAAGFCCSVMVLKVSMLRALGWQSSVSTQLGASGSSLLHAHIPRCAFGKPRLPTPVVTSSFLEGLTLCTSIRFVKVHSLLMLLSDLLL